MIGQERRGDGEASFGSLKLGPSFTGTLGYTKIDS
jgi:hypothetical protein